MPVTFGNIAYRAFRKCGQLRPGATASADMVSDALSLANALLNQWNADRLKIYQIDDKYFNITVSQQTYTVKAGGNFDPGYDPPKLVLANLVLLTNVQQPTRVPIRLIEVEDWAQIPVIAIQTQVTTNIYWRKDSKGLTIYTWPYPQTGNQFELFLWKPLTAFTDSSTVLDFPEGYEKALVDSLAWELFPFTDKQLNMGRVSPAMLQADAAASRRAIDKLNATIPTMDMDVTITSAASSGAPYNYLIGDYTTGGGR